MQLALPGQASNIALPSSLQGPITHLPLQQQQQQSQQQQLPQQQPQALPQTSAPSSKRRKKADAAGDEQHTASEPRRLRRSHEACARCRSKKIKCDSKHPRCTACATAGTPCHQEDRHRQTLTPRGHTERIEHQVAQCEALLKRHIPGFELDRLDEILAREGIELPQATTPPMLTPNFQFQQTTTPYNRSAPPVNQPPMAPPGQPSMYYPPPHMMPPPGYAMMPPYGAPFMPMQGPPGAYNPHMHPSFQAPTGYMPLPPHVPPPPQQQQAPQTTAIAQSQTSLQAPPPGPAVAITKGQDPNGNDMSNTEALAKNFGVSPSIVNDLKLTVGAIDREDLAVGSSGLSSGRDLRTQRTSAPDPSKWVSVTVRRNSNAFMAPPHALEPSASIVKGPTVDIWLPKDRKMAQHVVDTYFTHLNLHRPVFVRKDFEKILNDLYDGLTVSHDPGYICSVYLVFALGTLCDLNYHAVQATEDSGDDNETLDLSIAKKLMPHSWPEHDEFFERALSVKPDLRVTLSSVQALILLHWYLYTERQGRTLWRLVGSILRMSIELGLHHNPKIQQSSTQQTIFTEEESQLRITLWGIVLVHDRGTSILLGRPYGIAPNDFNTPFPSRPPNTPISEFSEHFELSNPIAEIQADIISSLYPPERDPGNVLMQHATRIMKRMEDFKRGLPDKYKYYFRGTNEWPLDRKSKLVQETTEDVGLTLLKIGIARILLLRALFSSRELSYAQRHRALVDAITTSHNMIIIHNQLIRFPDIAFFTSPIPLHIAAMVILYGHMSKCDTLPRSLAVQDLWLALDMLPRFRWRWERKDVGGGHPLIAKLAERVMEVDLQQVRAVPHPALLSEPQWDEDVVMSSSSSSQQTTPTLVAAYTPTNATSGGVVYGPHPRSSSSAHGSGGSGGSTPTSQQLPDVPTQLFYPFYPEVQMYNMPPPAPNGQHQRDYSQLLAVAAGPDGTYGCQPSHDSFISEERDPHHGFQQQGMQMWVNVGQRGEYPPAQT